MRLSVLLDLLARPTPMQTILPASSESTYINLVSSLSLKVEDLPYRVRGHFRNGELDALELE